MLLNPKTWKNRNVGVLALQLSQTIDGQAIYLMEREQNSIFGHFLRHNRFGSL
jgi:hypothetical protein